MKKTLKEWVDEGTGFADLMKEVTKPLFLRCQARSPYPGCRHEPNYWIVKDGRAHPVYVSGVLSEGVTLESIYEGFDVLFFMQRVRDLSDRYEDWEHFDLENVDEDLLNPNLLNSITAILYELELPLPKWVCERCGETHTGFAKFLSYQGNGGVGVNISDLCCEDCFNKLKWCEGCFAYVTPVEMDGCDEGEEEYVCPITQDEPRPDEYARDHVLYPPEDEAAKFGMDGTRLLQHAEGPPPVILIMRKGSSYE